jgi:hypothetical protein
MYRRVAVKTQRDQIPLLIPTGVAAKLLVVDFKVRHRTAKLTAPAIAPQYLFAELLITFLLNPGRRLLANSLIH